MPRMPGRAMDNWMKEKAREKMRADKKAQDPIVKITRFDTSFSGAWYVPSQQIVTIEGKLSTIVKCCVESLREISYDKKGRETIKYLIDKEKIYSIGTLLSAFKKMTKKEIEKHNRTANQGFHSDGYSCYAKFDQKDIGNRSIKETKTTDSGLIYTTYERDKSPF